MGMIVVAAIATLIAALVPRAVADMRRTVLAPPFRTLWFGFLAQSALIGSAILFAMTLIGLLITPAVILLALLAGLAGYIVASYGFGVGLMITFVQAEPDSIGTRVRAAGVGALVAGLIGLMPLLGWLVILTLIVAGCGAIVRHLFRPAFFVNPL